MFLAIFAPISAQKSNFSVIPLGVKLFLAQKLHFLPIFFPV